METFQLYTFEKYTGPSSRYECPSCKRDKQFTRYINKETGEPLFSTVGKCNRIDRCGYHYPPKEFFRDNSTFSNAHQQTPTSFNGKLKNSQQNQENQINIDFDCLSFELFERSLAHYHANNFAIGLNQLFDHSKTECLLQQFNIGTAKQPAKGTIFWQVDEQLRVRTGKIMVYNPDILKRIKQEHGKSSLTFDWVHSRLKREKRVQEFKHQQCLFGLHQLLNPINSIKSMAIGIVESEKTAIIASVFMPELIWMATGGVQNLSINMLRPLSGRKVVLFPDVNQYSPWKLKANAIKNQLGIEVIVSDFMEKNATQEMRETGADIADVLIKRDAETNLAMTDAGYPVIWDL